MKKEKNQDLAIRVWELWLEAKPDSRRIARELADGIWIEPDVLPYGPGRDHFRNVLEYGCELKRRRLLASEKAAERERRREEQEKRRRAGVVEYGCGCRVRAYRGKVLEAHVCRQCAARGVTADTRAADALATIY